MAAVSRDGSAAMIVTVLTFASLFALTDANFDVEVQELKFVGKRNVWWTGPSTVRIRSPSFKRGKLNCSLYCLTTLKLGRKL
jgi:hypothetical protein